MLPNRDIVATSDLAPADRLLLSAYARQTSERVWTLDAGTLLAAIDSGRRPEELTRFLSAASRRELPAAVTAVIADTAARARQLTDRGVCRILECADPALATLIARDRVAGPTCTQLGDRHLAVRAEAEPDFRKALRRLGRRDADLMPRRAEEPDREQRTADEITVDACGGEEAGLGLVLPPEGGRDLAAACPVHRHERDLHAAGREGQ